MRPRITLLVILAGLIGLLGTVPVKETASTESQQLNGRWIIVAAEKEGRSTPLPSLKETAFIFSKPNRLVIQIRNGSYEGTYKLNPVTKPRRIDYWLNYKLSRGDKDIFPLDCFLIGQGIYKLKQSAFGLCVRHYTDSDLIEEARPTRFRTQPGNKTMFLLLSRQN